MASSAMELRLVVFEFLLTTCETKHKQSVSPIFAGHAYGISSVFIFMFSQQHILIMGKPEYLQLEPHARRKMVPILEAPVLICGIYSIHATTILKLKHAWVAKHLNCAPNTHAFSVT